MLNRKPLQLQCLGCFVRPGGNLVKGHGIGVISSRDLTSIYPDFWGLLENEPRIILIVTYIDSKLNLKIAILNVS